MGARKPSGQRIDSKPQLCHFRAAYLLKVRAPSMCQKYLFCRCNFLPDCPACMHVPAFGFHHRTFHPHGSLHAQFSYCCGAGPTRRGRSSHFVSRVSHHGNNDSAAPTRAAAPRRRRYGVVTDVNLTAT
eukprot:361046-Chlamydomonas_euryale.AAC.2